MNTLENLARAARALGELNERVVFVGGATIELFITDRAARTARLGRDMFRLMSAIRARVQNGRLIVDAPTTLPEGTVLDLVVDDEGDDLDDAERAVLDDSLSRALASVEAGNARPAEQVLAALRR